MIYPHECEKHGRFEFNCNMVDSKEYQPCPICGQDSKRIWEAGSGTYIFNCDGAMGKSSK